jgi:hypothetical protein
MPSKVKVYKNPLTGKTRTVTKKENYPFEDKYKEKRVLVTTKKGKKVKSKVKTKYGKGLGSVTFKKKLKKSGNVLKTTSKKSKGGAHYVSNLKKGHFEQPRPRFNFGGSKYSYHKEKLDKFSKGGLIQHD